MRTGKPEHLKTFDYVGLHRYFLTFCTHERRYVFIQREAVALVWSQILHAAGTEQFAVLAYCFMPDHVHLLVEGESDDSNGRRFIARSKQLSGYHYWQDFRMRLWQRYSYERVLRKDEDSFAVSRYILENPVRARLVAVPQEYPFSGSTRYNIETMLEGVCQHNRRWSG